MSTLTEQIISTLGLQVGALEGLTTGAGYSGLKGPQKTRIWVLVSPGMEL